MAACLAFYIIVHLCLSKETGWADFAVCGSSMSGVPLTSQVAAMCHHRCRNSLVEKYCSKERSQMKVAEGRLFTGFHSDLSPIDTLYHCLKNTM